MNQGYVRRVLDPSIKAHGAGRRAPGPVSMQVMNIPSNDGADVQLYVDWASHSQSLALALYLTADEALSLAAFLTEAAQR